MRINESVTQQNAALQDRAERLVEAVRVFR